jgi:acyl-CoA synthetase (NDP forming)
MPDIGALIAPRSVAVVGASPDASGLRGRIMQTLVGQPYRGEIWPVSRSHTEIMGRKAYPSIEALPGTPDMAVLIIPAKFVAQELEACGKAGIKAAVILSSGFAEEPGEAGQRMQDEIRAIARRYDMAVNGPNSEGYANLELALCPTFSPAVDKLDIPLVPEGAKGRVAVVAQSGGMGFAFFDRGRPKELAFSHIVTTGNEACLEVFDMVDWLLDEGKTDAFLLLVEDIKTPATFRRVAEKALAAGKPLIVNKIGQSEGGARAAASHTAALAGSYAAHRALFRALGIVEGRDIEEMVDLAQAFLAWKDRLPAGRRVGICTASGGGGGWMADACAAAGLEVPELDAPTRATIDPLLPPYGTSQNPVDGTAQAIQKVGYAGLAERVATSPIIDGVMVVMSGRATHHVEKQAEDLTQLARAIAKPVLLWSYTLPTAGSMRILSRAGYPVFTNMRNAARAMLALGDYRRDRERFLARRGAVEAATPAAVKAEVAAALASAGGALTEAAAKPLLARYGIATLAGEQLVASADAAVRAAEAIGRPVALKVQSKDILHKTEAGALALGVGGEAAVRAAYERILASARSHVPSARVEGVLVQPMAAAGREIILGVQRDDKLGPMLMVGLGGIAVEVLGDVALAPCPLDSEGARALLAELRGGALLEAHRGKPAADVPALVAAMVALSRFASDHRDTVASIDLNPVIVHDARQGVSVADALIVTLA